MRILITADFQADWSNLDLCELAWSEILEICQAKKLEAIVVAGDLKHVYNPVDIRIIKWWKRAIRRARRREIDVLMDLGNHDRIGLHHGENWFSILRDAGAICVDKEPQWFYNDLVLIPFRDNKEAWKRIVENVVMEANPESTVMIFHEDINGCRYNKLGRESDHGVEKSWLHGDRFLYCIGGHIHLPQKIDDNIYYVGSPFAQDWGEANQKKRYLVIYDDPRIGRVLESTPSKIPGWFDPTWPGFYKPESWEGCKVRVHIECRSAVDYVSGVVRNREAAEKKYPGAEVFVSGSFSGYESGEEGEYGIEDSDELNVRRYVKETCPETLERDRVVKYLVSRLEQSPGLRRGLGVTFMGSTGENFLSFKEISVDWTQKGLTLVQGKNQDRMGKSNGSGKTSVLQTIPVALFGTTFKGQKHDGWARRNAKGKATIVLELRDHKNRTIRIERQRKPTGLRLWIDGKEQSSGNMPQGTQSLIEQVTGFTWQTLANAVYIDQEVSRAFIQGTKGERTKLLSKFQNLERFELALKLVREDRQNAKTWLQDVKNSMTVLKERISGCEKRLSVLIEESKTRMDEAYAEVRRRKLEWKELAKEMAPQLKDQERKAKGFHELMDRVHEDCKKKDRVYDAWMEKLATAKRYENKVRDSSGLKKCPTCMQDIDEALQKILLTEAKRDIVILDQPLSQAREDAMRANRRREIIEARCEEADTELNRLMDQVKRKEQLYRDVEAQVVELKRKEHVGSTGRTQAKQEIRECKTKLRSLERYLKTHRRDEEIYEYCERAMSRDGIPAFLNALLCQPLNKAAEEYSMLFADDEIRIRFELENGEFVSRVINVFGGEDIEDQSTGEKAMAGLIASFSLREIAPKSNLLILDEPGDGLDPQAARQFAKGLRELEQKFDKIVLTTHNQAITGELQDKQTWTVTKRNSTSFLLSN